jgi:hypothetical protein
MINKASNTLSNIIEPMNQAFDDGNFYGLEYVLDELVKVKPALADENTIDWFGATDYFA